MNEQQLNRSKRKGGYDVQTKVRIDAWESQDDVILAEVVLKHILEGGTRLVAFEIAGEKLNRTPNACGFRWNSVVRPKYEEQYRSAKLERVKRKKKQTLPVVDVSLSNVTRTVDDVEVKEINGQRVVTFKDIDELHGRVEGTARKRFSDNKGRFIEGEDYFFVQSSSLDGRNSDIQKFVNNAGTIFLTESGYLMLVKSFTDDLAWGIQRKLINGYFKVRNVGQLPTNFAEALRLAASLEEEKQKLITQNLLLEQRMSEYEPKLTYLDTILKSNDCLLVSQIAEDYGLTAQELNKILNNQGIQHKMNGQWLLYSQHKGLGYTKSETHTFTKKNGEIGSALHTKWTQKGRLFIHYTLEKLGIVALMDKKGEEHGD